MTALDDLFTRTLDDGTDRLEWLRARQGRVTASMVGKLLTGGPGDRRRLLEESFEPPVEIVGNRYIDRGHEREPVIAAWICNKWPGFEANVRLFHAADNTRHAATPDCVAIDPKGRLVLGEIKTSKYDRDPASPDFAYTGYYEQMQWQMYVCGADLTLFVWEQHDDDWDDGPTPLHDEPRHAWVARDQDTIDRLIATADLALAERDRMASEIDVDDPADDEVSILAAQILEARTAKAAAETRLKEPWEQMMELLSDKKEFSRSAGRAAVTWSNRIVTEDKPDLDAALAGEGAALKAEYDAARVAWELWQAKFTQPVQRSIRKLTVTEPKPKPAAVVDGEF